MRSLLETSSRDPGCRGHSLSGACFAFLDTKLRHPLYRADYRLVGNGIQKAMRFAVLAHAEVLHQGVRPPAQHVLRQHAEVAEYPEQIDPLPKCGPHVAWPYRRYQPQHAPA